MERREVVRYLALILAGAAAEACTPLRILTGSFPADFKHEPDVVALTLRAFTAAVIPRLDPPPNGDPARALLDRHYPFAKYAGFFASDLSRRATRRFGSDFAALDLEQRTAVIMEGLQADATTRKLYRGAIYLTQVANYAGIYDDNGCPLIEFPGRYRGGAISYEDPAAFLPEPLTSSGNAA